VFANKKFAEMSGFSIREVMNFTKEDIQRSIHPEYRKRVWNRYKDRLQGKLVPERYVYMALKKDGTPYWLETHASMVNYKGKPAVQAAVVDVTKRKEAEENLKKKEKELEQHAKHLENVNAALKVLIEHRDEEKKKLEENILTNVRKLILPYLEKLDQSRLREERKSLVDIIKSNLHEIISPYANNLSFQLSGLTLTELQVADMVKLGKTSKEIASLLNISTNAVSFHRQNIRKKLGITNKRINLVAYLQSFTKVIDTQIQ
jgi:PAS domain S-box-containing protein